MFTKNHGWNQILNIIYLIGEITIGTSKYIEKKKVYLKSLKKTLKLKEKYCLRTTN